MRSALIGLALVVAVSAGCNSSTSPSSTTTTTTTDTVASPTTTDTFTGVLDIGGTAVFPFSVEVYGTVNVTLVAVSGAKVPATVQLRLSLGTLDEAGGCTASSYSLVRPGTAVQLTATEAVGSYCVSVADVGNLGAPATVSLTVAHP